MRRSFSAACADGIGNVDATKATALRPINAVRADLNFRVSKVVLQNRKIHD
jgi:hypothetical protein